MHVLKSFGDTPNSQQTSHEKTAEKEPCGGCQLCSCSMEELLALFLSSLLLNILELDQTCTVKKSLSWQDQNFSLWWCVIGIALPASTFWSGGGVQGPHRDCLPLGGWADLIIIAAAASITMKMFDVPLHVKNHNVAKHQCGPSKCTSLASHNFLDDAVLNKSGQLVTLHWRWFWCHGHGDCGMWKVNKFPHPTRTFCLLLWHWITHGCCHLETPASQQTMKLLEGEIHWCDVAANQFTMKHECCSCFATWCHEFFWSLLLCYSHYHWLLQGAHFVSIHDHGCVAFWD